MLCDKPARLLPDGTTCGVVPTTQKTHAMQLSQQSMLHKNRIVTRQREAFQFLDQSGILVVVIAPPEKKEMSVQKNDPQTEEFVGMERICVRLDQATAGATHDLAEFPVVRSVQEGAEVRSPLHNTPHDIDRRPRQIPSFQQKMERDNGVERKIAGEEFGQFLTGGCARSGKPTMEKTVREGEKGVGA